MRGVVRRRAFVAGRLRSSHVTGISELRALLYRGELPGVRSSGKRFAGELRSHIVLVG